jgi:hypothetical protein
MKNRAIHMAELKLITYISVLFLLAGCSSKELVKNDVETNEATNETTVEAVDKSPEAASKTEILENGNEIVLFSANWIEAPTNIVIHEDAYRHVVGYASDDQVFRPNKSEVTKSLPVTKKQETLFNNDSMEHALDIAQTRTSSTQTKPNKDIKPREYYEAWVKECLHETMTEAEEMIVSSTDMPTFLNDSCIPDK